MRPTERKDALAVLAAAGGVLILLVVTHIGRWIALLTAALRSPVALLAGVAVVILGLLLVAVRVIVVRRALGRRVRVQLVPADSFDPADEAVIRFAAGLGRAHRAIRGLLDGPASAVRVQLDTDTANRLRYTVEFPDHARSALRTAIGSYPGVELHDLDPDSEPDVDAAAESPVATADNDRRVEIARAELVLARPSTEPLRPAGLDPDPLVGFARALSDVRREHGDDATVCVDLLPVTPGARRRMRARLLRQARRREHDQRLGAGPSLGELFAAPDHRGRGGAPPAELVERRTGQRALQTKLGAPEPLFHVQVLIRASSPIHGRAKALAFALLSAFDVWAGENHFRAAGLRVSGGIAFSGADMPWRRRWFDRRFYTGLFRPVRRRVVTASEIAGLLKPPTVNCQAPNIARSGGIIPPPPPGLPSFYGQRDMLPLGRVHGETWGRHVGVPLSDTFFAYTAGRSRYGKTESAIGQFLHLARSGHGCFFLDPHEDAIEKIKTYLTDDGLRERVVEINLADTRRQPGWNLFAARRSADQTVEQVDAVVDAFASALRWDETNTRALNLITQAAQALTDLARRLPPELAPTLFQVPSLLGNEDWRGAVLPFLAPATRQFFTDRFPRLPSEAITPVTNLIDRLRVSPAVAALLGSPMSSYDIRAAMDRRMIVLACPGSGSVRDRLVANFLVYDLLHAAKTRAALPPERRRPFHVFLDEVQTYDGAASGNLAALLEQTAKYGVRAYLFNQNPERLTPATLNAVTTNRSHLTTTALNAKAAALLTREWGGTVEPEVVTHLRRYTFLASITLSGETSPPFLLHGIPVDEMFPDDQHPERVSDLDAAVDRTTGRHPIAETLHGLDGHDAAILNHLREHRAQHEGRARTGRRGKQQTVDPSGGDA